MGRALLKNQNADLRFLVVACPKAVRLGPPGRPLRPPHLRSRSPACRCPETGDPFSALQSRLVFLGPIPPIPVRGAPLAAPSVAPLLATPATGTPRRSPHPRHPDAARVVARCL